MSSVKVTNIAHPSASGNNIVLDSGGGATFSQITGGAISSGTSVASTSGTAIDFTGIPSWVKRITVMMQGVSISGTSNVLIRLGTSSGIETTGYSVTGGYCGGTNAAGTNGSNAGFPFLLAAANRTITGHLILTNLNSNLWVGSGTVGFDDPGTTFYLLGCGGSKTTSGTLDRVRITTVSGTDTFDAGSVNILYEG